MLEHGKLVFSRSSETLERTALHSLVQELVDYRLAVYAARLPRQSVSYARPARNAMSGIVEVPYFPELQMSFSHFQAGRLAGEEQRALPLAQYGDLDPARNFIARASDEATIGKTPIRKGQHLLLENLSKQDIRGVVGSTLVIERGGTYGEENQYLLRTLRENDADAYALDGAVADALPGNSERVRARLKAVIAPIDMEIGRFLFREDVPALFSETFNPGNWNSGHIVLNSKHAHILFVTLNKQGHADDHRYHDHWVDEHTFHWQSQNQTSPASKKGQEIIHHLERGIAIHLFVRENKLTAGKGAPFRYHGRASYLSHTGSAPMSVLFRV
jgi:hypothetical protein